MPKDYDVEEAFRAIENELIDSMMRNLSNHRAEETKEGYNWTSWQAEQLKALNKYKQENQKKFTKRFSDINRKITESIIKHRKAGVTDQEIDILKAIKKGAKLTHKAGSTIEGAFFRVNDRKLDALLSEINGSMHRAETAMLRMANDQYRKSIFNAQVYFNTGAGTYEKAVDMATKDFLSRGINCVQYKNGARVNIASYAGMALRTANTRAYLQGEGEKRKEWGISTVVVHKRGLPCSKCAKWIGKILIDDVWSGGKASDGPYPLMSQAIAGGLYHPNCKDGHSTYYPGISDKPEKVTKKEMKQAIIAEKQESRDNLIQRNIDRFERLSTYSLDEDNRSVWRERADEWIEKKFRLVNFKTGGDVFKNDINPSTGFEDITARLLKTNNVGFEEKIVEINKYEVDGITYEIDGINVKQNNTKREMEVAKMLSSKLGVEIKLVPEVNGKYKNVKTPDYLINGERWDLKELTVGTSKELLRNIAHKKKKQTDNIIFDITKSKLSFEEINNQAEWIFNRYYNTDHINGVMLVKGDNILRILKRK